MDHRAKLLELKTEHFGSLELENLKDLELRLQRPLSEAGLMKIKTYLKLCSTIDSLDLSIRKLKRIIDTRTYVMAQSSLYDMSDGLVTTLETKETFTDVGGNDAKHVSSGESIYFDQGQTNITSMSNFLSRPVEIGSYSISVGSALSQKLAIWDLWSKVPSVRAKLRNFAFLRGNLFVRVSVSGTPFHYGKILVSYQPYANYNEPLYRLLNGLLISPTNYRPHVLNYLSQAEGSYVMSVNENTPLEMKLPFISPKPMHRLFNSSASTAISAATSFDDLTNAGDLFLYSINNVACASSTPSTINLQVYAWMEDVELGTNTGTVVEITTESDERNIGPIETISTSIAGASSKLTTLPYIGIYAKASTIAFSAIGKLASLFGWSKPVMNSQPVKVKNEPFQNGALTIGYDTSKRVVLDPKQELTVDPRVCGNDHDAMSIKYVASRRSYVYTFSWNDTDAAMTGPIFTAKVSPCAVTYWNPGVVGHDIIIQPTALAFAAAPFTYWRGTIKYRFEIVCSAFHRGKLAFFFEPNVSQYALINADISMNKQYMKVIDIQETQSVELCIPWASHRAWLKVTDPVNTIAILPGTSSNTYATANGYIGVLPFTKLQSPDNSDIQVNVYVWSDDIQFNGLTDLNLPTGKAIIYESAEICTEINCLSTTLSSCLELNPSSASSRGVSEQHFGEEPLSFRALLKRFVTSQEITANFNQTKGWVECTAQILPVDNMPYAAAPATITIKELFSYLRYAYLGVRGGVRVRVRCGGIDMANSYMSLTKMLLAAPSSSFTNTVGSGSIVNHTLISSLNGAVSHYWNTNSGFEAEFPYYSNNLFNYGFTSTYVNGTSVDEMESTWYRNYIVRQDCWQVSGSQNPVSMLIDKAAGEDFNLMRFMGAPFYSYRL